MPLEAGTYISDLVVTNPAHTDGLNDADAHLRLLKAALKATFPNINGAVTLTDEKLNLLGGDGSSGAPTYSFPSEPTLGFYRSAARTISFTGKIRGEGAVPVGAIMAFGMATAPTGWVECDGALVGRTDPTYADLFAAIGTTWGAGDGSTTFGLPGLSSRFLRQRDGFGLSLAGAVGIRQSPQNLAHTHSFSASATTGGESSNHTHGFSWSGTTDGMNANNPHTHSVNTAAAFNSVAAGGSFGFAWLGGYTGTSTGSTDINHGHNYSGSGNTGGVSSDHTHGVTVSGTTGSSGDANDLRPYSATVLYCIKL